MVGVEGNWRGGIPGGGRYVTLSGVRTFWCKSIELCDVFYEFPMVEFMRSTRWYTIVE